MTLPRAIARVLPAVIVLGSLPCAGVSAQTNRGKEYRSLNTELYHIEIQKNGEIDVFLGGTAGSMYDVFPMIWFDGEPEPERIKTDGRWTQRSGVEDRLGDGQGMVQQYKALNWSLRAYPTRPFFAVQAAYMNAGKKPVTVRAIMPWCIGKPGKGALMLGEGADESVILTGATRGKPVRQHGEAVGPDAIAIWNARSGRSLIAGFVTQARAECRFEVGDVAGGEESGFYRFRAICEFDPPVVVEPGEQITSEVLYIAIAETDPVVGLQRYARAITAANRPGEVVSPFVGWASTASDMARFDRDLATAQTLFEADQVPFVLLGDSTRPASAIPQSAVGTIAVQAERAASAGFQPVLWCDPTLVPAEIESIAAKLSALGVHGVAGVDFARLAESGGSIAEITGRIGALRRGLGTGSRIYATSPSLLASVLTDGVIAESNDVTSPVASASIAPASVRMEIRAEDGAAWRRAATSTLTDAALLFDLERMLAVAGGIELARSIFPVAQGRAVPADLFSSDRARVLHSRSANRAGVAHTVAVFNWENEAQTTALPLAMLGDATGTYYTVYDFWAGKYLGSAIDRLNVTVAPGDATLLVLRPLTPQPMPLLLGTNVGQSYPVFDAYTWDPANARLRMTLIGSGEFAIPLLIPAELALSWVEVSSGVVQRATDETGRVENLNVTLPESGGTADVMLIFQLRP